MRHNQSSSKWEIYRKHRGEANRSQNAIFCLPRMEWKGSREEHLMNPARQESFAMLLDVTLRGYV